MSGRDAGARAPRAAVIASGDELVLGRALDTNSAAIARRLAGLGWDVGRLLVLGDDEQALIAALRELARDHEAIVITGGLGPTLDDVTRHAVARAADVPLELDTSVVSWLKELFASRGRPFVAANERQALFPRGAQVLANPHGTAPGFCVRVGGALVFALPGPPREMQPMLEAHVVSRLERDVPRPFAIARRALYLFGLSESAFAERCGAWMARDAQVLVGVTAHEGVLSVSVVARDPSQNAADARAEERASELAARFAEHVFSREQNDLARVLASELFARSIPIALAESCTGGLLAGRLTSVPGISAVFSAGWVSYANAVKVRELGVPVELLERHGAVSREVAESMAEGAARRAGARLALAITGVAGPDGGTSEKPVGLVWFAVSLDGRTTSEERRFILPDRELIRAFAVNTALDLARRRVLEVPSSSGAPSAPGASSR